MPMNRKYLGIATLLVAIGLSYAAWQCIGFMRAQRVATAEVKIHSKEQIESDLRLILGLDSPRTIQVGEGAWGPVTLVNTSKTRTHRVLKSAGFVEAGLCEPHICWTATTDRGDGKLVDAHKERIGYCGTGLGVLVNWPRDGILLRPGESIRIESSPRLEFQKAGRVRLQVHYEFGGGSGLAFPVENLKLMAGVPAFRLTSNSVEFDVIRPLDVRVKVKRALKVRQMAQLSNLLEVTLVNQSGKEFACSSPTLHANSRLQLEIEGEYGGWSPSLNVERSSYGINTTLKSGEEVQLLGASEFANGLDGTWEYPKIGVVKIRAGFTPTTWQYSPTVWSDWVEVQVVE